MVTGHGDPRRIAGQIELRIQLVTHGRVRRVQVEVGDESIVLHGRASTYYAKQLAWHATQQALAERLVLNAIEVGQVETAGIRELKEAIDKPIA